MEYAIALLYSFAPVVSTLGYLPQIAKLWRSSPGEAKSFSARAWALWLANGVVALAYGIVHLKDTLFIMVSSVSLLWVAIILGLVIWKQAQVGGSRTGTNLPLTS
jgi:hypothetical protein